MTESFSPSMPSVLSSELAIFLRRGLSGARRVQYRRGIPVGEGADGHVDIACLESNSVPMLRWEKSCMCSMSMIGERLPINLLTGLR